MDEKDEQCRVIFWGIDVSTTATKALLIDEHGEVISVVATEYPFETPYPLWSEQDAALFWKSRALIPGTLLRLD